MMTVVLEGEGRLEFIRVEDASRFVFLDGYYILFSHSSKEVGRFGADRCLGVFEGEHAALNVTVTRKDE